MVTPSQAASLQPEELRIIGKALSFMDPAPRNPLTVAVVYLEGDPSSRRDAEDLALQLDAFRPAGIPATPEVVSSSQLSTAAFEMIITATGLDSELVIEAAQAHRALCITASIEAVEDGHCTMAIRSSRKVEIFINRDVASRSGVNFATAFRMMVHEQ